MAVTTQHPPPQEPEPLACEVCLREIPATVEASPEGPDYLRYYCGLDCLELWHAYQALEGSP